MKKLFIALFAAVAIAGSVAAAASADTGAKPEMVTIPIDGIEDGCSEPIAIEGSVTEFAQFVTTPEGNRLFHIGFQTHNMHGTGLLTGTEYRDVSGGVSVSPFDDGYAFGIIDLHIRIFPIGGGDALTFVLHETFHITKLNYENVVIFDRITVGCV